MKDNDSLERAIAGALRSTIKDHGPITPEWIGSAVKRIMHQLPNAKGDGLARALVQRRWDKATAEERAAVSEHASKGGSSAWAGMSKAERSAEMKRRAAKRSKKV